MENVKYQPSHSSPKKVELDGCKSALVVKSGLEMTISDIARKIRDVVQEEWTVFDPKVKEPLVVAHTRLARLYGDRHNEVRRVDFMDFPPNKERTIRHPFQNGLKRKFTKTVT